MNENDVSYCPAHGKRNAAVMSSQKLASQIAVQ